MGCVYAKDGADDGDRIIDDSHLCCSSCFSSGSVCKACSCAIPVCRIKKCCECGEVYCTECLHSDLSRLSSERVCTKCLVLLSGQFMPQDLMAYSVRELRQFLFRKDVAVDHCVEKADLIELIMLMSCSSEYLSSINEHSQHLQMLRERMQREQFPEVESIGIDLLNDISTSGSTCNEPPSISIVQMPSNETSLELDEDKITSSDVGCEKQISESFTLPLRLDSTEDADGNVDTTDRLSINQITDTSGESKEDSGELMSSATDLAVSVLPVREPQDRRVQGAKCDGLQTKEGKKFGGQLCCVCSRVNVDCVFLECGHMVACYSCGEQLTDCPVCLNYVTRCVRAFRA